MSSANQSRLKKQVLEKRAEFKKLQDEHKRLDDLVFRLLNEPSQYQADVTRLQSLRKESAQLRKLLGVQTKEELLGALQQVCAHRDKEIARRKAQVNTLRSQKKEIDAQLEALGVKSSQIAGASAGQHSPSDANLSELASEVKLLKSQLASTRTEVEKQINSAKLAIQDLLKQVYAASLNRIGQHDAELAELQEEQSKLEKIHQQAKQKLTELEQQHSDIKGPLDIEEDPEEAETERTRVIKSTQKVLSDASNRLNGKLFDETLIVNINISIDNFAIAVDRIRAKIAKFAGAVQSKKELASEHSKTECVSQSKDNLRLLLRLAGKCARVEQLFDSIAPELKAETDRIVAQIEREERDQSPVGDTNLTISELRKEIIRLEREIFKENFYGERFKEEMKVKAELYQRLMEAEVERNK